MKKMKKFASLFLVLIMSIFMSATAFAANSNAHTITITNEKSGHTYTAYQVFAGDISNDKLTNIEWGSGVDGAAVLTALKALDSSPYASCDSAEAVAAVLAGFSNNSDELNAFSKVVGAHLTTAAGTSTETKGETSSTYTINVTGDGYYLIKDTGAIGTDDAATNYILKVIKNVTVKAKVDTPTIDKTIVDADDGKGNGTAQDVGSVVNFKLVSNVPEMDGYTSYTYIVHDTMSSGLTPVDADKDGKIDVNVTIGGASYTDFTVTMSSDGQSFTVAFNNFINQKSPAGKEIVITYAATINENALNTDKETNTVYLEYSNNPNDNTSKGQTPEDVVYVYDFDIVIDKYAKTSETAETKLAGAKFVLLNSDKTKYYYYNSTTNKVEWYTLADGETLEQAITAGKITEVTTGENGDAKFQGLDCGSYYLHETASPAGYNLLKEDVGLTITATYGSDGQITSSNAVSDNNGQYQRSQKIENKAGAELPSTGGIGTYIFYAIGSVLVIGALVLLITKKRMNH